MRRGVQRLPRNRSALLAGVGIGELPPFVRQELVRQGRLVEVMQNWRLRTFDLWLLHLGNIWITVEAAVSLFAAIMNLLMFQDFRDRESLSTDSSPYCEIVSASSF